MKFWVAEQNNSRTCFIAPSKRAVLGRLRAVGNGIWDCWQIEVVLKPAFVENIFTQGLDSPCHPEGGWNLSHHHCERWKDSGQLQAPHQAHQGQGG